MNNKKDFDADGYIPPVGFISGRELARKLRKADHKNLIRSLKELGVDNCTLCGTTLFNLESFAKLFWKEDE